MNFPNVVLYCVLLLFAKDNECDKFSSEAHSLKQVVISNEGKKKPTEESDDDVKHTFAKLLKTIVKVNEERMQAMEKITRLQDYMLNKNKLKTGEDAYDSMEEEDNRILLAFADMPLLRRTEDETITRAMCNRFNLERNNVHLWTNQFLKLACHNHSIGQCVSACKKSVEKLCEKFHCNLNTRRSFKTECHENCSHYFEPNKE